MPGRRDSPGSPAVSYELTSLDERLGLLLVVRIALVVVTVLAALFAPGAVGLDAGQVGPLCAGYLVAAGLVETYRRSNLRGRMIPPRVLVPVDGVFLTLVVAASGGPRSPLLALFAVHLVAVTLLAGPPAGLSTTLWDSILLATTHYRSLVHHASAALGLPSAAPGFAAVVLAVGGLWAVAICTAVFSAVSERELRRSKAEMAALADMAAGLERLGDEEEILGLLLSTTVTAFGFRRGALLYVRDNRPAGLVADRAGAVRSQALGAPEVSDAVSERVWELGQPQLVRRLDPVDDPIACSLLPGATNVVVLPLLVDGDGTGIVLLEYGGNPIRSRLPRRTLVMLVQFAGHAALALRNARLLADRERLAAIDGLTGLANRREFDAVMAREVSRAQRSREPLSLIVFDVDHFKQINDTRGHLAGDEVLRALAQVAQLAVREMDVVARYGGEEFAVILPRCDQHDAIRVVERIAQGIRQRPDLEGVTISSGVATVPFNAHDVTSLISAADEAMYESKRAGRDRYSLSARRPDRESFGPVNLAP